MTTKHDVIRLHAEHPEWNSEKIAKALGCKSEYVRSTFKRNGLIGPWRRRVSVAAKSAMFIRGNPMDAVAIDSLIDAVAAEEPSARLQLVDLQRHQCKFPLGDPRQSDFGFCAKPQVDGYPYCRKHCELSYHGFRAVPA